MSGRITIGDPESTPVQSHANGWLRSFARRSRGIAWPIVLAIAAGNALVCRTNADDAFITYRYALNLSTGHGPVFNVGERVEGYSNFVWMIVLSSAHWLLDLDIEQTARFLGLLAGLATVFATYWLVLSVTDGDYFAAIAAGTLLASAGTFAIYILSGLETPLFSLLLVLLVGFLVRGSFVWAGVIAALAMMTRPEGSLIVVAAAVWILIAAAGSGRTPFRSLYRFLGPVAAIAALWTLWRVSYYGYVVPNALAAKSGGLGLIEQFHEGFKYFNGFALANVPLLMISGFAIAVPLISGRRLRLGAVEGLVASFVASVILTAIMAGGDWMPAWRLFAPILPLWVILIACIWHRNLPNRQLLRLRPAIALVCGAAIAMLGISFSNENMIPRARLWRSQVAALSSQGKWLRDTLPATAVVATYANGALSYNASPLTAIDMLGLTDEHIARDGKRLDDPAVPVGHRAYDNEYLISRRPDVLVPSGGGFAPVPSCAVYPPFSTSYVGATFRFSTQNPTGNFANVLLRSDESDELANRLRSHPGVALTRCP
jgi:arabinofuranosyltransferase